ncbi:hypothetical protein, conserved [Babesia ovata]|uniref:C3H1-type domain-containing protein n=1 Tax=Babesia ovata TaxID=189622 RepID=A0A2H6KJL6_9APIC|nr:uncharacterized protein BOVATA_046630 [Babesia ovata]GBE63170.1 hypothetical protein, conserved [Babesia ovata]
MSFLHGVLHNIKPKLGLHKESINDAIKSLNTNKHSGKEGFNAAIGEVVQGVREYNEGVRRSNQQVKITVENLQSKVSDAFVRDVNNILPDIVAGVKMEHSAQEIKSAETLIGGKLEDCEINASAFVDSLSRHSETIDNFNNTLCNRVRGVISSVEHEKVRLHDVAAKEKDILTAATDKIGDALNKLKCSVNDKIKVDVGKLVKEVKEALKPIKDKLEEINRQLIEYTRALEEWIANAEAAVKAAFDKVEAIINEVDETKRKAKNKEAIETAAEFIRGLSSTLNEDFAFKNEQFRKAVEAITNATEQLKSLHESVTQAVPESKLEQIKTHLGVNDEPLKGGIKSEMKDYVEDVVFKKIQEQVGAIKDGVGDGKRNGVINTYLMQLKEEITKVVGWINGPGSTAEGDPNEKYRGLKGIQHKVKMYAEAFRDKFEKFVEGWIINILDKEPVKSWLGQYAEDNNGVSALKKEYITKDNGIHPDHLQRIASEIKDGIKEHFKTKLNGELFKVSKTIQNGDRPDSIQQNVEYIQEVCTSFAKNVGDNITKVNYTTLVFAVQKKIETALGVTDSKATLKYNPTNLSYAVQLMLPSLSFTARQTALALGSFTTKKDIFSLGFNLDAAIHDVGRIKQILGNGKTDGSGNEAGDRITAGLTAVGKKIKELHDNLDALSSSGSTGPHNILGKELSTSIADNVKWTTVDPQLATLLKTTADAGIQKLHEKLQTKVIDEILEKIDKDVTKHEQSANNAYAAIIQRVNEITNGLTQMCNAIKQAADTDKDSARTNLKKLRDTYFNKLLKDRNSIHHIHKDLLDLQNNLESEPLKKLKIFLEQYADKMLDLHVKSLHKQVNNTVKQSQDELTTQAKKDYVVTMQLLIQQFAERVRSDLNGLPQAISDDLEQGHKGFMAKLHEQFLNRFNTYLRTYNLESRTLRDIAGTVCYQFSDFMEALYKQEDFTNNRIYVEPSRKALQTLLTHLANSQHFDRIFTDNLKNLRGTFNYFAPKRFHTPNSTLIDPLREGIRSLAKEVGYGYVNTYSGEKPIDGWVTKVTDAKASEPKTKLTDEGKNCAKVCLTVFYTLNSTLQEMKQNCGSNWRGDSVTKSTKLGQFLADQGYDVSDAGKQNGEIDMELRGGQVNKFLVGSDNKHVYKADGTISTLTTLYDYLETYNHACHLRHVDGAKAPLSVFHMLSWLAGLTYSPMLGAMYDRFISLFDKPTEYKAHNHSANYTLDAYPSTITAEQMETSLYDIMSQSHDLLTSILGHGHAGGIYACDHLNNSNNLLYPNNPGACFDLLAEILQRLSQQLSFLYYQCDWNRNDKRKKHREEPFEQAVKGVNFENPDTDLDITSVFKSTKHSSGKNTPHHDGDLHSLVSCNPTSTAAHPCGPYLRPLSSDLGTMLSKKNADKYLSWIVYVTETFYDLLKKLFDECNKQCGGDKPKCRIARCPQGCKATNKSLISNHSESCNSIVNCTSTLPTFCKYGFVYENSSALNGMYGDNEKRTCRDFCDALKQVLKKGNALGDIVHKHIPAFLWEIRYKFFYTLLALWSLSLLYLLHIAVVRLDVLRIRSHLRSPSSHRIAAQSLLAVARVGKIANVKYFSP